MSTSSVQPIERIRERALNLFIAFLSLSALLAITTVLTDSFGEFGLKVLATTSVIAAVSLGCLVATAYAGRGGKKEPAQLGLGLSVAAGGLLMLAIWGEVNSEAFWKLTAIVNVFAIATVHTLALWIPRLHDNHRWTQTGGSAVNGLLASLISLAVLSDFDIDGIGKVIAALSIVSALCTLVVPILSRLQSSDSRTVGATLTLTRLVDGEYADQYGNRYELTRLGSE